MVPVPGFWSPSPAGAAVSTALYGTVACTRGRAPFLPLANQKRNGKRKKKVYSHPKSKAPILLLPFHAVAPLARPIDNSNSVQCLSILSLSQNAPWFSPVHKITIISLIHPSIDSYYRSNLSSPRTNSAHTKKTKNYARDSTPCSKMPKVRPSFHPGHPPSTPSGPRRLVPG